MAETLEIPLFKPSKSLTATVAVPPSLKPLEVGDEVPRNEEGEAFGVIRVMLPDHGDKRFAWNPRSIAEINEARDFFNDCVRQGLVPYHVGTGGQPSSAVMDEFDPFAGDVIFVPVAFVAGG